MSSRILLIDDDEQLADMVQEYLARSGFEITHCATAGAGVVAVEQESYDAVVLDIMLPDFDGFEACKRIRQHSQVPVLMLSARGDAEDRIVGLELGADDYLPKPFIPRELLARLRAVMRRRTQTGEKQRLPLHFGRLTIDREARSVCIDGEECPLTGYQFDLLCSLAENAGRVLSRDQLMDHLRGHEIDVYDRSIDVHISRIRAAIEDDPKHPRRILTVRGAGYLFTRKQDEQR